MQLYPYEEKHYIMFYKIVVINFKHQLEISKEWMPYIFSQIYCYIIKSSTN